MTYLSRTALLTGKQGAGKQADEVRGFAAMFGNGATLLHRRSLEENTAEVLGAVGDPKVKVVGVVLNAVDEALDGALQIAVQWNPTSIRHLLPLLSAASAAHRTVVVASDHGHILDWETTHQAAPDSQGARWRSGEGAGGAGGSGAGEQRFEGRAIEAATERRSVVCATSESIRYADQARGYHGGASLAELVAPLFVLGGDGDEVAGWVRG